MEGELDNTVPGKVSGWMRFAGLKYNVVLDLTGDFHRDIRGTRIHFVGNGGSPDAAAARHLRVFAATQTGEAGDITAGLPPRDYVAYPYIEWYSRENGRVVLELEPGQVKVIARRSSSRKAERISGEEQDENVANFLHEMAEGRCQHRQERNCPVGQTGSSSFRVKRTRIERRR